MMVGCYLIASRAEGHTTFFSAQSRPKNWLQLCDPIPCG